MNVAFGDIVNQGKYAIYVSNISEEGVLIQGNNLWVQNEGRPVRILSSQIWRATWAWSWEGGVLGHSSGT